jgi:hypothetical protein
MITDCRQLVFLGANNTIVLALNLPGRSTLPGEFASDHDRLAVFFWLERLFALVLDVNRNFGGTK